MTPMDQLNKQFAALDNPLDVADPNQLVALLQQKIQMLAKNVRMMQDGKFAVEEDVLTRLHVLRQFSA